MTANDDAAPPPLVPVGELFQTLGERPGVVWRLAMLAAGGLALRLVIVAALLGERGGAPGAVLVAMGFAPLVVAPTAAVMARFAWNPDLALAARVWGWGDAGVSALATHATLGRWVVVVNVARLVF